jgi:hypothetical protein
MGTSKPQQVPLLLSLTTKKVQNSKKGDHANCRSRSAHGTTPAAIAGAARGLLVSAARWRSVGLKGTDECLHLALPRFSDSITLLNSSDSYFFVSFPSYHHRSTTTSSPASLATASSPLLLLMILSRLPWLWKAWTGAILGVLPLLSSGFNTLPSRNINLRGGCACSTVAGCSRGSPPQALTSLQCRFFSVETGSENRHPRAAGKNLNLYRSDRVAEARKSKVTCMVSSTCVTTRPHATHGHSPARRLHWQHHSRVLEGVTA